MTRKAESRRFKSRWPRRAAALALGLAVVVVFELGVRIFHRAPFPKNDDEKRDEWLIRFSREVGRDLGPYFEAWGVPTSEKVRASIAELPEWKPAGFEGKVTVDK